MSPFCLKRAAIIRQTAILHNSLKKNFVEYNRVS